MGFELDADSEADPLEWIFIGAGPSVMVSSPSGMHPRGIRYHLAVWPGPADGQAAFVACAITKGYASGGREGHISLLSYGPDLRKAIRAINENLAEWRSSEHYPPDLQPSDHAPLDENAVIASLKQGSGAFGGDGWDGLDAIARRTYRMGDEQRWLSQGERVRLSYHRE